MKTVLIAMEHDFRAQKVTETGLSIAKAMGVGFILQHVAVNEFYFKLLDIVNIMGLYNKMKNSYEFRKMTIELKEVSKKFLNKTKLHIGEANFYTLLEKGESKESVLEMAKEIDADVIFIIMASIYRKKLQIRVNGGVNKNDSINSTVRVLTIPTNKESIAYI